MNAFNYFFHPAAFFHVLRHTVPVPQALLTLLIVSILSGAIHALGRWQIRGLRSGKAEHLIGNVFAPICSVLMWTLMLTCLHYGLLHLVNNPISIEWLTCIAVFAALPIWSFWLMYTRLQGNWYVNWFLRAFLVSMSIWSSLLFWIAVNTYSSLALWQAMVVIAPFLAGVWTICVATLRDRPDMLSGCLPWRTIRGDHIVLFYPPDKARPEMSDLMHSFERVLERVTSAMGVEPLCFPVHVFMFPDDTTLVKEAGPENSSRKFVGISHGDSISLAFPISEETNATVAHEIAHVLREQRVTKHPIRLLDEGLAVYVERTIYGDSRQGRYLPISWRTMALHTVFYQHDYSKDPEFAAWDVYNYAYSIAAFLISRFGMKLYLELCRKSASEDDLVIIERFASAIQSVYDRSIDDLESDWRACFYVSLPSEYTERREREYVRRIEELELLCQHYEARLSGQGALQFDPPIISRERPTLDYGLAIVPAPEFCASATLEMEPDTLDQHFTTAGT